MEVRLDIIGGVNELKRRVLEETGRMMGSVTASTETYDRVMGAIWKGMQDSGELPEDTGALKAGEGVHSTPQKTTWTDKKGGVHNRTIYPRVGNTYVTTHARSSTLHIDPYEIRPSEDVYYAGRKADEIYNAFYDALDNPEVLENIANIVGDVAKKSRK